MKPFEARFAGTCTKECGTKIKPGDEVLYPQGNLMHAECPETDDVTDKPIVACPVCWLTLCWCD